MLRCLVRAVLAGTIIVTGLVGAESLPAAAQASQPTGNDTASCTGVSGTLTFSPPLTKLGSTGAGDTVTLKSKLAGCTASGTTVVQPLADSTESGSFTLPDTLCSSIGSGSPIVTVTMGRYTIISKISFSSEAVAPNTSTGDLGFQVPGPGGTVSTTSGFVGTDGGASSSEFLQSNLSQAKLTKSCASAKGLKSIKIVSGSLSLQ